MRLCALLLPVLLAGCLDVGLGAASDPTFRFVEITSRFRAEPEEGLAGVCGFASPPDVDAEARTVTFHDESWPGRDVRVLLLHVTWDETYCGVAHTSYVTSASWNGTYPLGEVSLEMRDDGTLAVDGVVVPTGASRTLEQQGTLADGRAFTQSHVVRDHGAWPTSGLRLAERPE